MVMLLTSEPLVPLIVTFPVRGEGVVVTVDVALPPPPQLESPTTSRIVKAKPAI